MARELPETQEARKLCLSRGPDLALGSPRCASSQDGLVHPLAAVISTWLSLTQTFPVGSREGGSKLSLGKTGK